MTKKSEKVDVEKKKVAVKTNYNLVQFANSYKKTSGKYNTYRAGFLVWWRQNNEAANQTKTMAEWEKDFEKFLNSEVKK